MKKERSWLFLTEILLLCITFYVVTMFPQDRIYSEHKRAFKQIRHAPGTEFVANYNAFGALDKTRVMYKDYFSQGCDYRVAEIRKYSGSPESIRSFYAGQSFEVRGEVGTPGVLFIPFDQDGVINRYGLTREEITAWGAIGFDTFENLQGDQNFWNIHPPDSYYYVGIGGFSFSDYDIRCLF